MKLTRHNGRVGKNGTYNPKHNDRSFDLGNSDHIDENRARGNLYWDCYQGLRRHDHSEDLEMQSFEQIEKRYYEEQYQNFVSAQNVRNDKARHSERNRSTEDLLKNKKTCPEETLYQIGSMEQHVSPEVLQEIAQEFFSEIERRFGEHVHILDWALHLDESTPHIHERHVFDCKNAYGELAPQQEKALEMLEIELPDPEKKMSRNNNRKISFDRILRALLFEISKKHGLALDEEPEYGGREYLEKQDYILMKQKEKLKAQEGKLDELNLKISDIETLVSDVSDAAYEKAVETVTETVRKETKQEDIQMIEDMKEWLQSPDRKAPKEQRRYAADRMDTILQRILRSMKAPVQHFKETLLSPIVRRDAAKEIERKTKSSVLEKLYKRREQMEQERKENNKELHNDKNKGMEL